MFKLSIVFVSSVENSISNCIIVYANKAEINFNSNLLFGVTVPYKDIKFFLVSNILSIFFDNWMTVTVNKKI